MTDDANTTASMLTSCVTLGMPGAGTFSGCAPKTSRPVNGDDMLIVT